MITFIVNDAPYGNERPYNGLRLAMALMKAGEEVRVFFTGDGVLCGLAGQKTPNGYYNIGRMIQGILKKDGQVHA